MALSLKMSKENYKAIGKNAINYQNKLENQSKEINNISEEIKEVWNGKNSKIATDALEASAKGFMQMSKMIAPYNREYKKIKESLKTVYGDMD